MYYYIIIIEGYAHLSVQIEDMIYAVILDDCFTLPLFCCFVMVLLCAL